METVIRKKLLGLITNKYVVILFVFAIWMFFFDQNSILNHRKMNKEIQKVKTEKEYYQTEIKKDEELKKKLNDPEELQRYAREHFYMKKEGESIFVIEYDTLAKP